MSKPSDIYNAIQSQLQNAASLSYMDDNAIFIGLRQSFDEFPAICIEEGKTQPEKQNDFNVYVDVVININLFILIKPFDANKQIVGDIGTVSVGAADILNDIKIALSADTTLGGKAIDMNFGGADPLLENWPNRNQSLVLIVLFRQNRVTRQ